MQDEINLESRLEAIIIHPHLLRKFMRYQKDFPNLLALYTFYLYTAQTQQTNSILATDSFAKHGLNWAMERVKKTKKLLKGMGVITLTQKGYYSYIQLSYIYTQKKILSLLKKVINVDVKSEEKEVIANQEIAKVKVLEKSQFVKVLEKNAIPLPKIKKMREMIISINKRDKYQGAFNQTAFANWLVYCERNAISYNKNNMKYWIDKFSVTLSIEQMDGVTHAIKNKWKNFYLPDKKASKYQKYIGLSLLRDKEYQSLKNIYKEKGNFVYVFLNEKIVSSLEPHKVFADYGYEEKAKQKPILASVRKNILGMVKRF
jgi:hypothetical protein